MEYKQSEPLLSISNVSFAAVRFGETDQFIAVIAIGKDGNKWMISAPQPKMTLGKLHREVADLVEKAAHMAAREAVPNYCDEAAAYVRGLPEGHRSSYLTSVDKELHEEAEADIKEALQHALTQVDSFRAAVEFESRVPYLIGNRNLVLMMDDFLSDFQRKHDQESWIVAACERSEEALRRENTFLGTQILNWKKAESLDVKQITT